MMDIGLAQLRDQVVTQTSNDLIVAAEILNHDICCRYKRFQHRAFGELKKEVVTGDNGERCIHISSRIHVDAPPGCFPVTILDGVYVSIGS